MTETEHKSCPSCGKPNPADAKVCRFCTAEIQNRVSVFGLYGIGILALLIVAVFHFRGAILHQPAYVEIQDLTAARNFDRVRVLGRVENISVTKGPYDSRKVRIDLSAPHAPDRSYKHRISVRLEGEHASDFLAQENPVTRGDLIEVAASLFAGENYRHLSVNGAQFIWIKEKGAAPPPRSNDAIRVSVRQLLETPGAYSNQMVFVPQAQIVNVSTSWPSFVVADLQETNRTLIVFGYETRWLRPGLKVSVRGHFEFYDKNGYWEIKTRRGDRRAVWVHKEKKLE
jgi:predicted nucleic acid-binding Zn ribbon protein